MINIINPANGKLVKTYEEMTDLEVEAIIDSSHSAFLDWRDVLFAQRSRLLRNVAKILLDRQDEFADLMTMEMGKLRSEALAELKKCAWVCEHYADGAKQFLVDETVKTENKRSFINYRPLGVILAVMPWNFPFWQVFRFVAPALMAGNAAVLKHARSVTGCALAIESIFSEAGSPDNLFRSLLISGEKIEAVIENKHIRAVTLTGSTEAGRQVAAIAGKNLKKSVLELGGSDPYIVLADADINLAAEKCALSRMLNGGQSCIAAKRFIVVEEVYDEFVKAFQSEMSKRQMGDPRDLKTTLGPQANDVLRDQLHNQVQVSIEKGAQCILGGELPKEPGAWYPATILTDVVKGMPAYEEELFGPVAAVIKASNVDEAIAIANDSDFGLGGAIFTRDIELGQEIASDKIDCGTVVVNGIVTSDPRLPFGGTKNSGYGRELSIVGIREFVNIKSISVN